MTTRIITGDCREVLKTLPDESVHCVVTSPPYWGLRDYGTAKWEGGDAACDHKAPSRFDYALNSGLGPTGAQDQASNAGSGSVQQFRDTCGKCGAKRADLQLGLEQTPDEYVAGMVEVFREVRRVLRKDGTLWLNLGDSYSAGANNTASHKEGSKQVTSGGTQFDYRRKPPAGLKPKDLVGIPWRVAFALQADGWVLRQEIIWGKPNPMPESVRDRCTKSHEQIFLFAKARWSGPKPGRFADISEEDARWLACCIDTEGCIVVKRVKQNDGGADSFAPQVAFGSTSRALIERFVGIVGHGSIAERPGKNSPMYCWQVGNKVARDFLHRIYPHLIVKRRQARIGIYVDDLLYYRGGKLPSRKQRSATENDQLVSLWARNKECNRFGQPDLSDVPEPEYGRWSDCERYYYDAEAISEPATPGTHTTTEKSFGGQAAGAKVAPSGNQVPGNKWEWGATRNKRSVWTVTTAPFSEAHFATFPPALIEPCVKAGCPQDGTILDPFGGAGTTGLVADRHQRNAILIELNPEYAAMAERRIHGDAPLFAEVTS